jgi:hypothetical protein
MCNRYQSLGRFEYNGTKDFQPVDRRAKPLTSEPARYGPKHAADGDDLWGRPHGD